MPDGNHYLLEIGTEELPKDFLLTAPAELEDKVRELLSGEGVPFGNIDVYGTPRRLAISVEGLPELQEARTSTVKGPPVRVGLTADGQPSPAGLGFARKSGVEFSKLTQDVIDGETYLILKQTQPGRSVQALLSERLPALILSLSGSHFMAWGSGTIRFSRPIRWIVSLWNDAVMPLEIGILKAGNQSRGHRFLCGKDVVIPSAAAYLPTLEKEGAVLASIAPRRQLIDEQLHQEAGRLGGSLPENPDLLDTVTMLVEKPFIVAGRFAERFLDLPEEVTITVMAAHQKYFPVRAADPSGKLLPYFLAVSNGRPESSEIIRHGNEKVITARLEDARFFFEDDQKTALEDRLSALAGVTFQKGLGSMAEKTARLEQLSCQVAEALGYQPAQRETVQRAARLAKADLVTGMVFEFTELQGTMGRHYARLSGEAGDVCEAIYEHYLPRFTGDAVATNPVGIAVSLADKLDTLMAVFSQTTAKLPSGSKDPLGLRRMAAGVIQTVFENRLSIDLDTLLRSAYATLRESIPEPALPSAPEASEGKKQKAPKSLFRDIEPAMEELSSFILQRLKGLLLEQGYRYDVIDAVLENKKKPLKDLSQVRLRLDAMKTLIASPGQLQALYEPANRIYRILGEQYDASARLADVDPSALRHDAEKQLFAVLSQSEKALQDAIRLASGADADALISLLSGLSPAVTRFFEDVMVNDPDATVRKNRYNLLSVLNRFYLELACLPKLSV